jgi:hypothetical protein
MFTPAAIATGVTLLAGLPVTGVLLWQARQPATPAYAAGAVTLPESRSTPASPVADVNLSLPKPSPEPKSAPDLTVAKKPVAKFVAVTPAVATVASDTARRDRPIAVFSRIKLLILGEDRPRDHEATLRLAADGFEVLDGTRAIESAAWPDVIGLYHSHSKEPRWTNADGQSATLVKTSTGGLGFFRGTPDWVTLRTRRNFVPLRVREEDVERLLQELEARSTAKVVSAR